MSCFNTNNKLNFRFSLSKPFRYNLDEEYKDLNEDEFSKSFISMNNSKIIKEHEFEDEFDLDLDNAQE